LKAAAASTACAELCLEDSTFSHFSIARVAIETGNVKVLEWARVHGEWARAHGASSFLPIMFSPAVEHGHVDILKWAAEHDLEWFSRDVTTEAARHGHTNVLEFVLEENKEFHCFTAKTAVSCGHVSVLSWMKERNILEDDVDDETPLQSLWETAIVAEQISVLDWLLGEGYEVYPALVERAVQRGIFDESERLNLKVLQWAKTHNIKWDASACGHAAVAGNLTALKWLRENGCPWDVRVIETARQHAHEHVAEWAIENGCPQE
jgi:hypothetical protein